MADYNITFPDGTPLLIQQGTINNIYDLPLTGQDAINYGDDFATAYIRLLSSFANTSPPSFGTTRKEGQLWFDTTPVTGGLNVFDGVSWDSLAFDANVVHTTGTESIGGIKTFTDATAFTASGSPFTVNSSILIDNLNAEFLNGSSDTAFATAAQGQLADQAEPDLLNPAMSGYILSSLTDGTRSWIAPTSGTGNIDPVDITDVSVGDPSDMSVVLSDTPTGDQPPVTESGLTFDGTTNTLKADTFQGSLAGNADSADDALLAAEATVALAVRVADESSDTTCFPLFVTAATGDLPTKSGSNLTFNSSSGLLTATTFSGSGTSLTNLDMAAATDGVLAVVRGGTGVTTFTGLLSSTAVVLNREPTFVNFITTPVIRNGATGTTLEFNSSLAFRIVSETATNQCSGAEIVDGSGVPRPVGFNIIPNTNQSGATISTLNQERVGYSLRGTNNSGTKTYTCINDSTIPDGATWVVKNLSTATGVVVVTSAIASGVVLRWMDGSGSPQTDTSGATPFTLARGGVATVQKIGNLEYEMWGIGIS